VTAANETRQAALLVSTAPAAGLLLAGLLAPDGPKGLFQADLVGLVLAAGCGAFGVRGRLVPIAALAVAGLLCGLAHAALAGSFTRLPDLWLLVGAVGAAASGLAALGRAVGAPALSAGTVGASVLWIAMTGLFWADPLAETLPATRQYRFRQAVLHLDPATAAAYSAARFDRLHDPRVYRDVPLAASLIRPPAASHTGSAWLAVGLLAWGVAGLLGVDRRRSPPDATEAPDDPGA
jgi:transposase